MGSEHSSAFRLHAMELLLTLSPVHQSRNEVPPCSEVFAGEEAMRSTTGNGTRAQNVAVQ